MDLPPQIRKGIEQFNQQEFFECHETLEHFWRTQIGPERELTQGIIQIAVGYHHLLRGNYTGAAKLFQRGLRRIASFRPRYFNIDLEDLTKNVEQSLEQAISAKPQVASRLNIPRILCDCSGNSGNPGCETASHLPKGP